MGRNQPRHFKSDGGIVNLPPDPMQTGAYGPAPSDDAALRRELALMSERLRSIVETARDLAAINESLETENASLRAAIAERLK